MKQILLPRQEVRKLRELFGVSAPTVWEALRYKTKSPRAEKIRQTALARGGQIYEPPKAKQL